MWSCNINPAVLYLYEVDLKYLKWTTPAVVLMITVRKYLKMAYQYFMMYGFAKYWNYYIIPSNITLPHNGGKPEAVRLGSWLNHFVKANYLCSANFGSTTKCHEGPTPSIHCWWLQRKGTEFNIRLTYTARSRWSLLKRHFLHHHTFLYSL